MARNRQDQYDTRVDNSAFAGGIHYKLLKFMFRCLFFSDK